MHYRGIWQLLLFLIFTFLISNSNVEGNYYASSDYQSNSDAYPTQYTGHQSIQSYPQQQSYDPTPQAYPAVEANYKHGGSSDEEGEYNMQLVYLLRFWSAADSDHLYTIDNMEAASLVGYVPEGVACLVFPGPQRDTLPVFRLYNFASRDSFYTANPTETGSAVSVGYTMLGVGFYCYTLPAADRIAFHRYWNPTRTDHFYTTNFKEIGNGQATGYNYEGILCYCATQKSYANQGYSPNPSY